MGGPRTSRAKLTGVAVARARVIRAGGITETYYSAQRIPWWQLRRRLKLRKHLKFMRGEDQTWQPER